MNRQYLLTATYDESLLNWSPERRTVPCDPTELFRFPTKILAGNTSGCMLVFSAPVPTAI